MKTKFERCGIAIAAVAVIAACGALYATDRYVDPANGSDATGTTGAKDDPFLSINAAINAADADDTIILLPGDHTEGRKYESADNGTYKSYERVQVSKRLVIRSLRGRETRDATRIVGSWDTTPGDYPYGMGSNSVRCVTVTSGGAGTRFEGITFYGGAAPYLDGVDHSGLTGGGGAFVKGSSSATFVDCAFRECQSLRGGAINAQTLSGDAALAVRCLFKNNRGSKFGLATFRTSCFGCVFDDNCATRAQDNVSNQAQSDVSTIGVIAYGKMIVNCTIVNNQTRPGYTISGTFGNNIVLNGATQWPQTVTCVTNVVSDVDPASSGKTSGSNWNVVDFPGNPEVYSPFDEDYRLVRNAQSIGYGSTDVVDAFEALFPNSTEKDYEGKPCVVGGRVSCGAVQEAIGFEASGIALRHAETTAGIFGNIEFNGKSGQIHFRTFAARPGWPVAFNVKYTPGSGSELLQYAVGGRACWPKRDGSIWVSSAQAGKVEKCLPVTTTNISYVDPENGDDDNGDGSSASPWKTLSKAIAQADSSAQAIIARQGDFNERRTKNMGLNARVVVPGGYEGTMLIKSEAGPESTFISGEEDGTEDGDSEKGTGTNAVRCVSTASAATGAVCFQGFTLRNGRTNYGTSSGNDTYGAAFFGGSNCGVSFVDCVISNCCAGRGVVFGGTFERCVFTGCSAYNQGLFRRSTAISSVVTNCSVSSNGMIADNATAYNCTIVKSDPAVRNGTGSSDHGYIRNSVVDGSLSGSTLSEDQGYGTLYKSSTASQAGIAGSCKAENPVKFDGNAPFALSADSKGYRLASVENMRSIMDFNGNPFAFGPDGMYTAGAVERDWKGDLAKAVGNVNIVFTDGHSTAYVAEGGIFLPGGGLNCEWTRSNNGEYRFHVNVSGNGTLTISVNGDEIGRFGSGFDDDVTFVSEVNSNSLAFLYEPGADDAGGVLLSHFRQRTGLSIQLR